jgi:uncharacterized membrane protein
MWRAMLSKLLNSPDLAGGRIVDWRLGLGASGGTVLLALALLAAVGVSLALYRHQHRVAGRRWQVGLAALRAAAFAALALLLLQPVLHVTKTGVVKSTCVILVDRTKSFQLADRLSHAEMVTALRAIGALPATAPPDAPVGEAELRRLARLPRFDLVKQGLAHQAHDFLDALDDRFAVEVLTFGAQLEAPDAARRTGPAGSTSPPESPSPRERREALRALLAGLSAPDGETTRLGAALRGTLERFRGRPLAGIILITDGAQNAGEDPRVVAAFARNLDVPLYPVGVGAAKARDLQLAYILGDDVVFKDDVKPLTVRLKSLGYTGRHVTLVLSEVENGVEKVLKVRPDVVVQGDGEQTEEIEFVPKEARRMDLRVRVEPLPDEQNPANNVRAKVVRVIDKKIRVLYVEGRPRWEYRYLVTAMRRDRRVEPTVLLQEADPETATPPGAVRDDGRDTSPEFIKTFPDRREDLFAYDVILFGAVNLNLLSRQQMRYVAEFVEMSGGGFALIAGEDLADGSIGPRAVAGTPLEPLLPVSIERPRSTAVGRLDFEQELLHPATVGYRPRLTAAGRGHPVVRLGGSLAESERLWGELPEFYWYYPGVSKVRPAAQVLLEHPSVRDRSGPLPLLVTQPYGQGKTVFVGFDEVWRWRAEKGDEAFYQFYGQMIQYLGLSHLLGENRRIQVTVDRREVGVGEPVAIFARVLDESFRPEVAERVTAVVRRSAAGSVASPEAREVGRVTLSAAEGAPGAYRGQFIPQEEGEYQIAIDAAGPPSANRESLAAFTAAAPHLELGDPSRNQDLLRALAELSGGVTLELDQLGRLPALIQSRERQDPVRFDVPLWDSWLALLLVVAIPCVEWLLRKRVRLA